MAHTVTITSTTPNPCGCCGGEPPDDCFSCRTKGPTATLCGYPEFVPVDEDSEDVPCNTPGKIYRKASYSGALTICDYNTVGCSPDHLQKSTIVTYSGACEKDVDDCSQISNASVAREVSTVTCGGSGTVTTTSECPVFSTEPDSVFTPVVTEDCTVLTVDGTEECSNFGSTSVFVSGEVVVTLSEEDTEADAIVRLLATASWSSYGSACVAGYQVRTGPSFSYTDVQWRVVKTGLLPSTSYDVDIEIWRRSYGVGSYVLYSTLTATGTTDGSGNLTITGDVPNDRGYQSEARCDCVVTLS